MSDLKITKEPSHASYGRDEDHYGYLRIYKPDQQDSEGEWDYKYFNCDENGEVAQHELDWCRKNNITITPDIVKDENGKTYYFNEVEYTLLDGGDYYDIPAEYGEGVCGCGATVTLDPYEEINTCDNCGDQYDFNGRYIFPTQKHQNPVINPKQDVKKELAHESINEELKRILKLAGCDILCESENSPFKEATLSQYVAIAKEINRKIQQRKTNTEAYATENPNKISVLSENRKYYIYLQASINPSTQMATVKYQISRIIKVSMATIEQDSPRTGTFQCKTLAETADKLIDIIF